MQYFPVFMDLKGQDVLVVGGGAVAERKIRALLSAGATVQVTARELSDSLQLMLDNKTIHAPAQCYDMSQLAGKRLVFAATDDIRLNRRVFRDAERIGIFANVVDDKAHCRFISPAVVDRSPVLVAISTGGASPVLARKIRRWIERLLPQGLGGVALAAAKLRDVVKHQLSPAAARRFWEAHLSDDRLLRWSGKAPAAVADEMKSLLNGRQPTPCRGMVYLVGAGPGNPDLLTLRALDVLGQADVILHDRLVSDEILDLARRDADRIYVGKQAGNHHCRQEEIHRIMLEQAALGRTVVRLKGGDAFIFGRGGEELEILANAGVRYEVVPGITAAIGSAAFTGIPLTHRSFAQSVTFVTGHQATGSSGEASKPDWARLAGKGKTAVVYMGVRQACELRNDLLEAGISASLPVALVENGSRDDQQVFQGTVASLPALARQATRGNPGLLIIGEVAALGRRLGWFKTAGALRTAA